MIGNGWQKVNFPYSINKNTILEFDFRSDIEGEIHGIGFDNNNRPSKNYSFQLYGTQPWSVTNHYNNYNLTPRQWQHYRIPVGQFYTGQMDYLTFIHDEDVQNPTAVSQFANIKVYDQPQLLQITTFAENGEAVTLEYELEVYVENQNKDLVYQISEDGNTLTLIGNGWQKVDLPYSISEDTILEFDFRSDIEGEIHAIGFDNNNRPSRKYSFQLYGTQPWGIREYQYNPSEQEDWQHYLIPVGEHFTGEMSFLTFINDQDIKNPTAVSQFANLQIYPAGAKDKIQLTAALANDTGTNDQDSITSDPTISGVINSTREIGSFQGRFLSNEQQEFIELIALVAEDGSFSLDQAKLTEINHSSLPDGNYTLELIAADLEGKQSEIIQLDFTLDTAAPSLFLETPIPHSNHSKNARIIGSIPDQLEQIAAVEYQLDGATPLTLHLDEQGRFDSPLPTTTIGTHSLVLTRHTLLLPELQYSRIYSRISKLPRQHSRTRPEPIGRIHPWPLTVPVSQSRWRYWQHHQNS